MLSGSHFDAGKWKFHEIDKDIFGNTVFTTVITMDLSGDLWIGTWGFGVVWFDGLNWINYTEADGFMGRFVNDITVGPDGEIWVGSDEGIARYWDDQWLTLVNFDYPITSIAVDKNGDMLFGTDGYGLYHQSKDGSTWYYTVKDGLGSNYINSILIDQYGVLWLGTPVGITRIEY